MCLGYGGTATTMRQVLLKTAKEGEFIEYNFLWTCLFDFHTKRWAMAMKARPWKGLTELLENVLWATLCMKKGSKIDDHHWIDHIVAQSLIVLCCNLFLWRNTNINITCMLSWSTPIHRWVIENLLAVGRHFQKTSYEKEVDGEKQVGHVKRSVGKLSWMSHCHEKKTGQLAGGTIGRASRDWGEVVQVSIWTEKDKLYVCS